MLILYQQQNLDINLVSPPDAFLSSRLIKSLKDIVTLESPSGTMHGGTGVVVGVVVVVVGTVVVVVGVVVCVVVGVVVVVGAGVVVVVVVGVGHSVSSLTVSL